MAALNETIHQTVRLRIMAALVTIPPGEEVDFSYLRDLLEVTDGLLDAPFACQQRGQVILGPGCVRLQLQAGLISSDGVINAPEPLEDPDWQWTFSQRSCFISAV